MNALIGRSEQENGHRSDAVQQAGNSCQHVIEVTWCARRKRYTGDVTEGSRDVTGRTWRTSVKHGGARSRSHCVEHWTRLDARHQGHPRSCSQLAITSGASWLVWLTTAAWFWSICCCRCRCCLLLSLLSSLYWCLKLEMTPHEVANDAERMPRLYTAHDISGGDCWKSLYLLKTIGPQVTWFKLLGLVMFSV